MVGVKGCSGIEGSSGPEWKGLTKGGALLVGPEKSAFFQWYNKGRVCYKRCSSLAGEADPQIRPYR